jgi:hypothetical protein
VTEAEPVEAALAEFKAAVLAEVVEAASVEAMEAASAAAIVAAIIEEIMAEAIEAAVSGESTAADLAAAMEMFAEAAISGRGIKYIPLIITAVGDFTQATLFSGQTIIGHPIITGLTIQPLLITPRLSPLLFT